MKLLVDIRRKADPAHAFNVTRARTEPRPIQDVQDRSIVGPGGDGRVGRACRDRGGCQKCNGEPGQQPHEGLDRPPGPWVKRDRPRSGTKPTKHVTRRGRVRRLLLDDLAPLLDQRQLRPFGGGVGVGVAQEQRAIGVG